MLISFMDRIATDIGVARDIFQVFLCLRVWPYFIGGGKDKCSEFDYGHRLTLA